VRVWLIIDQVVLAEELAFSKESHVDLILRSIKVLSVRCQIIHEVDVFALVVKLLPLVNIAQSLAHEKLAFSDYDQFCAWFAFRDNYLSAMTLHILKRQVKLGQR